jgi:hypothetical protein
MKTATLATIYFAAAFAIAIAPAQTGQIRSVPADVQNAGSTDLNTDYLLTGPDLMLVPYDPGIVET